MPSNVRCYVCHRVESWTLDASKELLRVVEIEGGARQPREHPHLAAWRVIARGSTEGLGHIVGRCDACDMPLLSSASDLEATPWSITAPDGVLHIDGTSFTGPQGPLTIPEATSWLEGHYRERFQVKSLLDPVAYLRGFMMIVFVGVLVAWLMSLFCVTQFYMGLYQMAGR